VAELYGDENLWPSLAAALRARGHDVLTVRESGRHNQRRPDRIVVSDATALRRAVRTFNRVDFVALHRRGVAHAGILVFKEDPDVEGLAERIDAAIREHQPLANKLIRVRRPPAGTTVEESPGTRRT